MNKTLNRTTQLFTLTAVAIAAVFGLLPPEALLLSMMLGTDAPASPPTSAGASDGSAPGTGTPAAGGGPPPAGGASTPAIEPPTNKQPPQSRAALAAERAQARLAAAAKPNTSTEAGQQAPGGGTPAAGTSTEPRPGEGNAAKPAGATADGEGTPKGAAPASTVTAPTDWPKEDREAFEKIPDDGKQLVLGIQKRMHAGFTHAMTQLSEESKSHQEAITIGKQFQADPKAAIAELAKRANLEVFFERPTAEDNPPADALNDPVKYANWIADKAVRAATKNIQAENTKVAGEKAKQDEAVRVQQAGQALQQEFAKAAQDYPDFAGHKPKVVAILQRAQGGLSTEEAYRLVSYDAMVKRVNEGETAKRELATLKADQERKAKDLTRVPAGGAAPGAASGEDKFLSPGARAMKRAEGKLAAAGRRTVGT